MKMTQVYKKKFRREPDQVQETRSTQRDTSEADAIMAAIDETVAEMGEEFAVHYRQKGGQ